MSGLFVSSVILAVNGLPIVHCKRITFDEESNRKLVIGMSPTGTPIGHTDAPTKISGRLQVYIPKTGDIPWSRIGGLLPPAVITVNQVGVAPNFTIIGVFVKKVSSSFEEESEAMRTIEFEGLLKTGVS